MTTSMVLDRTNFDILDLLTKDARLSNKQIAAAVGLAPSSCHERLKQLRDSCLLRGAHADVDFKRLGIGLEALVHMELAKHERDVVEAFIKRLNAIPEVRHVFLVAGRFDVLAHVAIRDMDHLKNLNYDHFTNEPAVLRIETSVVYESWGHMGRLPLGKMPPEQAA